MVERETEWSFGCGYLEKEEGYYTFSDLVKWVNNRAGNGSDLDSDDDEKRRGRKGGPT